MNALIALALALVSPAPAATTDAVVVRVNGTPIRQSEILDRLWKRYGPQTVEEMVDELLLRQAAQAKKLKADDAEVSRRLKRLEAQFANRELFISQLEQAGSSLTKVREDLSEEFVRERLVADAKGLEVSDDEVKQAFDRNKDKLGRPEAVHLRHILAADQKAADEVVAKIKAGADFKALARERSQAASGKTVGGDYGFVSRGMLPQEIDEIAFAMKAGDIRVVPSPRGRHVLQVLATRAAQPAAFGEVKDDLREMLLAEKIKEAAPSFLQDLRRNAAIKADAPPRR